MGIFQTIWKFINAVVFWIWGIPVFIYLTGKRYSLISCESMRS